MLALGLGALALAAVGALWLGSAIWPYPVARIVDDPGTTWRVVDRDGVVLREAVGPWRVQARWAPLAEVSPAVVQGLIAIEDRRFYRHPGVDGLGVARALGQGLWYGHAVSGASTLTMQLARLLGDFPRDGGGKLRQVVDAVRIERVVGKDEILEQYLNRAMFAPGTQGIEAASLRTFGGPSRRLTLAQAATMAGLAQAPVGSYPTRNLGRALRRRHAVLDAMLATGVIRPDQHAEAAREPLVVVDGRPEPVALHFTDHVLALHPAPGTLETTLSGALSRAVQAQVAAFAALPAGRGVERAAVVALDPASCDVIAMVGSLSPQGEFDRRTNWATTPLPSGLRARQPTVLDPLLVVLHAERPPDDRAVAALRDAGLDDFEWTGDGALGEPIRDGEVTLLQLAVAFAALPRGGRTCAPRVLADDPVDEGWRLFSAGAAAAAAEGLPLLGPTARLARGAVSEDGWTSAWAVGLGERHVVAAWASGPDVGPLADRVDAEPLLRAVLPALAPPPNAEP